MPYVLLLADVRPRAAIGIRGAIGRIPSTAVDSSRFVSRLPVDEEDHRKIIVNVWMAFDLY
jgi:hypothetical protein